MIQIIVKLDFFPICKNMSSHSSLLKKAQNTAMPYQKQVIGLKKGVVPATGSIRGVGR
jgi:hypothetical protein